MESVDYIPMQNQTSQKRRFVLFNRYRGNFFFPVIFSMGLVIGVVLGRWAEAVETYVAKPGPARLQSVMTVFDSFTNINSMSPALKPSTSTIRTNERAVVTSLYNDGYAIAVSTLGYSLSQVNTTARRIVIYIPERVSQYALCHVKEVGWELYPVSYVSPPHNGDGVNWMFVDQYTKLRIWTLDEIGIKAAVYLDADTLVKNNFDELFDSPFKFSAVPDVYLDERGFTIGFNAGVLAFKPDSRVFDDMMAKVEGANYNLEAAEQAYLNLYYGQQAVRLPHVYNGNLAIKSRSKTYWDAMQEQMRIVHYTLVKPFVGRPSCDGQCTVAQIFDPVRHRAHLDTAKGDWGGTFREEIEWWGRVYEEMMAKVGDVCTIYG